MVVNIIADRHDQILHVAKDAAAETLVGEVAEESSRVVVRNEGYFFGFRLSASITRRNFNHP